MQGNSGILEKINMLKSKGIAAKKQCLTREQLKESCRANPQIKNLIERNAKILRGIDR